MSEKSVVKVQMSEAEGRDLLESPDGDATKLLEVARCLEEDEEAFEFLDHRGNVFLARDSYEDGLRGWFVEKPDFRASFEGYKLEYEAAMFELAAGQQRGEADKWQDVACKTMEIAEVRTALRNRDEHWRQAQGLEAQAAKNRELATGLLERLDSPFPVS